MGFFVYVCITIRKNVESAYIFFGINNCQNLIKVCLACMTKCNITTLSFIVIIFYKIIVIIFYLILICIGLSFMR